MSQSSISPGIHSDSTEYFSAGCDLLQRRNPVSRLESILTRTEEEAREVQEKGRNPVSRLESILTDLTRSRATMR